MMKKKIPSYDSDESTSDSDDSDNVVQPLPKIISKNHTATNKILTLTRIARSGTKRPIHNEDLDSTLIAAAASSASSTIPAEVKEYRNSYVLEIDVPGMKLEDIKVDVKDDDNVVVISGERKREEEEEEEDDVKYLRMETRFGKFIRSFVLPHNANIASVSASCRNGVLTVTVLKKLLHPDHFEKPMRTIQVKNGLY